MKKTRQRPSRGRKADRGETPRPARRWPWAVGLAAAAIAVLLVYEPALTGPFVFDDEYLPFTDPYFAKAGLYAWVRGVRPLLMFTFWINLKLSGLQPFSYHLLNVVLHLFAGMFVFLCLRRLLRWAGEEGARRDLLAAFGGGLFLLHPLQTESVAYVASRSEVFSVMLFYAAVAVFLYRRAEGISWLRSLVVLALFGAAVSTKEHAAVLPLLLLLIDYYMQGSSRGWLRNWRLYTLFLGGGAAASWTIWGVLRSTDTAGFRLPEFNWLQYFYTQCRAIWVYIRIFFLPYGQNLDHDFPISKTLLSHGALFGLIGLMALAGAAIWFRRRFPLASLGVLAFFLLLAPTSSFLPILDPLAERRMYLPMFGLILVVLEFLRRWDPRRAQVAVGLAVVLVVSGAVAHARNRVWNSAIALWEDSARKSPNKSRPNFQLAFTYYSHGRCADALRMYERVAKLGPHDYRLLVDWALAYDCLNRRGEALAKLQQVPEKNAHVYSLIGMVHLKERRFAQARAALDTSLKLDPNFALSYVYRAAVHLGYRNLEAAAEDYRRALALNPDSDAARKGLAAVEARLRARR